MHFWKDGNKLTFNIPRIKKNKSMFVIIICDYVCNRSVQFRLLIILIFGETERNANSLLSSLCIFQVVKTSQKNKG